LNTRHKTKAGFSWGQALTLVAALVVVAATVYIAQSARVRADRYNHAEVLALRAESDARSIEVEQYKGMADRSFAPNQAIGPGFNAYNDLTGALTSLRKTAGLPIGEWAPINAALNRAYVLGVKTLSTYQLNGIDAARSMVRKQFAPAIENLTAMTERIRRLEQNGATSSAKRSENLFILSVILGVAVLLLLGLRFERLRRKAVIAASVLDVERLGEERLRSLVRHASDVICVVDADGKVEWIAESIERVLGYAPDRVIGEPFLDLVEPGDRVAGRRFIEAAIGRDGPAGTMSLRLRMADGSSRHIDVMIDNRLADDSVGGLLLNLRDVSEQRVLQEQLRHQALHDSLTGLANRAALEQRTTQALQRTSGDEMVAVMLCDLDDFKTINDSLGHSVGELVLREVAGRIGDIADEVGLAARLGGDEFALLLTGVERPTDAIEVAGRIRTALHEGIVVGNRQLRVTASVGVAFSDEAATVDELLRNADVAMYVGKGEGGDTVTMFASTMHTSAIDRLELGHQLERAIATDELELDFQPVVRLEDGSIIGAEALVRWAHPTRGRLGPGAFIGLAETSGLIVGLGAWVLRTACKQLGEWHRNGHQGLRLSVNVSIRQLADPDLPQVVATALREAALPAGALTLELTESLLADDNDHVRAQLLALRRLGVGLAVDDFGTGYSALSYLRTFPIDVLKVDRSFVDGIDLDSAKARLVRGIIDLAESLDLEVIAEGIEREGEIAELRAMGATLGQGFLFSMPVGAPEFTRLLDGGGDKIATVAIAA
jgi:diguanylate cyclase (GGDEF)-like protein/PAS domain S-box-containing protein